MFLTSSQNNHTNKVTIPCTDKNILVRFCLEIALQHNITLVWITHTVTLILTRSSHLHLDSVLTYENTANFFPSLCLQCWGDGGYFILERTIEVINNPDLFYIHCSVHHCN